MIKLAGPLNRYPARVTSIGFAVLVVVGTLALATPWASADPNHPLGWLDSLFMSTSAVCVTGLSVRSLASDFSFAGQIIMLVLIQIGGLGIMTLTTFVLLASGSRGHLRHHLVISTTLAGQNKSDLRVVLRRVFAATAFTELVGFACLYSRLCWTMEFPKAVWNSIFLSVSAFCNAGFALDDQSLIAYQNDPVIITTISFLIIVGGIGYPVLFDLAKTLTSSKTRFWEYLHIHSKLTIIGTLLLLLGGFLSILLLEWNNPVYESKPQVDKFMIAAFQSVTCRTAGFNSVDLTKLGNATLIVMMILMLIGGGPCSTAGGMKVPTFFMLIVHAVFRFRGRHWVTIFRRTIPQMAIDRAMATAILFVSLATIAGVVLLSCEQIDHTRQMQRFEFVQLIFEAASALGTVGLSIGQTANLTTISKFVVIGLMFLGRLGPISFFSALSNSPHRKEIQYASEEPIIG